jgi:DNA-binding response OmpR family regulator
METITAEATVRLLVAEDHPSLARSIAEGLKEEGYAVDVTLDGLQAEQMLHRHQYDCVVLDIMLPGKDGFAILKELRDRGDKTPVLCVTARDSLDDRVQGLDLGADDYQVKPFAWDELLARVRALIRRSKGAPRERMVIADLVIDTTEKSVTRAGKSIQLTTREFMLLEYLANREGKIVTRAEICKHLYGQPDEVGSNVVDVYIGYLRNKIDKEFDLKLIHTRRGKGYMLSAEQ